MKSVSVPALSQPSRAFDDQILEHGPATVAHNAHEALHGVGVTTARALVSVVDDDESVRESLPDLLQEFGFAARAFASAEEFLASDCVANTMCLILDVAMPGMSGPALQRELYRRQRKIPIVFITAHRDDAIRRRLLEAGAVDCLFKPFSETTLLEALNIALLKSAGPCHHGRPEAL